MMRASATPVFRPFRLFSKGGVLFVLGVFLPVVAAACSSGGCLFDADWEGPELSATPEIRLDFRYDYISQSQLRQDTQAGNAFDRGLQPGTGSTDLVLGTYRLGDFNRDWGWFGRAPHQSAIGTKEDYRPGSSLNLNLGSGYYFSQSVSPQLQINAQLREHDGGANGDPDNSGGRPIYLSPSITVNLDRTWKIFSFIQFPLYQQVNGLQPVSKWNFLLGTNYRF